MKINLSICGIHELSEQGGKRWTHVISIWNKSLFYDPACRDLVKSIAPRAKVLFNFFDDISDATHPYAPRLHDVKRILEFTKKLPAKPKILVHCHAGVSRSTATAYAILCQHSKPGLEMENLLHVQTLRDLVLPNRIIIEHADKVLKRKGAMLLHLPDE